MKVSLPLMIKEYGVSLEKAGVPKPFKEAQLILNQILGSNTELDDNTKESIENAMFLRKQRMPIERIFGLTRFYGLTIYVENDVFKPYPETEDLVHYALNAVKDSKKNLRILDLGTGTGCILLALLNALPGATGVGVDICEKAVETARENARINGLLNRAEFKIGDWTDGIQEKFDLVISNPPRALSNDIPNLLPEMRDYDPMHSLDGGQDGLSFVRRLVKDFDRISKDDGICLCQVGAIYAVEVEALFRKAGFSGTDLEGNFAGYPCCVTVRKNGLSCEAYDDVFSRRVRSFLTR